MKLKELKQRVDAALEQRDDSYNPEVTIVVKQNGQMGATHSVNVKYASAGFDWNTFQFMITPEEELIETKRIEK